jgi:hypothetical protein
VFPIFTCRPRARKLSLSLPCKKKAAKLNAFPEADGNRARRSNPISANLSRGKDKCILLCGTARARIYSPENIPYMSGFKWSLYSFISKQIAMSQENHCFLFSRCARVSLFLSLSLSLFSLLWRFSCCVYS